MLQAVYDFSHGYWGFFLYYWVFITFVMLSRQFFAFIFYVCYSSGLIFDWAPRKADVTMFVTIFDEDPDTVARGLASVRASFDKHCSKFVLIAIIDGADIFPDETLHMAETVKPFADLLLTTNARKKRQNLRNMVDEAKKLGILYEISAFLDSDTILDDEHVARELLRPFGDNKIGGVTTAQRGLDPQSIPERIGDWLENARLYSSMAAGSLFGQVGCLPGRLYAVRSSIIEDKMDELVEDYWKCGILSRKPVQCVAGDDRVISNWVLEAGYQTVMMPNACVRTVLPHTWVKMFKTWERWGRSSQGYTLRTLQWSWKTPWVLYQNMTDILVTLSTIYLICVNWPLSIVYGDSDRPSLGLAFALAIAGMALTVMVRQLVYLSFNPKQILLVPFFIVAVTIGQFMRFKALVTPHRIGIWGTRNGADNERTEDVWVRRVYTSPRLLHRVYTSPRLLHREEEVDESRDEAPLTSKSSEQDAQVATKEIMKRRLIAGINAILISGTVAALLALASGLIFSESTSPFDNVEPREISVGAFVGVLGYNVNETEAEFGVELDHEVFYQRVNRLDIDRCKEPFSLGKDCIIVCEFRADYWVLPNITRGDFDDVLLEFSDRVKPVMAEYPERTFYLRPLHEFNGDWYNWGTLYNRGALPGEGWNGFLSEIPYQAFIDAWVHIVDLFRSDQAPILFQLTYNSNNGHGLSPRVPFSNWYPGDEYVDQVLISGFNRAFATRSWKTFDEIYARPYAEISAFSRKEIGIAEVSTSPVSYIHLEGVSASKAKAKWIEDACIRIVLDYPRLVYVTWFLENKKDEFSDQYFFWGLNSDAEISAFAEGVALLQSLSPNKNENIQGNVIVK